MTKDIAKNTYLMYPPTSPILLRDLLAPSHLLSPAAILPEQFYRPISCATHERGEIALMRAVLTDAVSCFQHSQGPNTAHLAKEAERWIFRNDQKWPFSFVNICSVLGLDPEYIRLGLRRWRKSPVTHLARRRRKTDTTISSHTIDILTAVTTHNQHLDIFSQLQEDVRP